MRATISILMLAALVAFGQTPAEPKEQSLDRTFYSTHTKTVQELQEIATGMRTLGDIREVSVDGQRKTITLRGTPDQVSMAEWLFNELDKAVQPHSATPEFRVGGSGTDVVRVFYFGSAETVQDFQEAATSIRTLTNMRRVFTYNAPRAVSVRGTSQETSLAEWLFQELDKPAATQNPGHADYPMPWSSDDLVRVFYLKPAVTVPDFQKLATQVRAATQMRQVFTYNRPRAVMVRGTAAQLAQADRLFQQFMN